MKYNVLPLGYVVIKNVYEYIIFHFQYNYCIPVSRSSVHGYPSFDHLPFGLL